jgi:hypothetical protein
MIKFFRYIRKNLITLNDYKTLKNDAEFSKLLSAIAFENSAVQNRGAKTEKNMRNLIDLLDNEIKFKE